MVGLKDVAAACGLSVAQVSRALAGKGDVSESTRIRVEKAAAQMNYVKNFAAHALSAKHSDQLAVIVTGLGGSDEEAMFPVGVMRGVNAFAAKNGHEALVHLLENAPASYEDYCRQRGVGGVIIINVDCENPALLALLATDFPCVVIDVPAEGVNKGCVLVNNIYYARLATQQLVARGRKNIAMISGNHHSMVELERRTGYESALVAAGLPVRPELVGFGGFSYEGARAETLRIAQEHPETDAYFCASDLMALGCVNALRQAHKKVPRDVSVFGFDGLALGEYARPALSTIRQDQFAKGYEAAKLLAAILRRESTGGTVMVPCEMCLRGSI